MVIKGNFNGLHYKLCNIKKSYISYVISLMVIIWLLRRCSGGVIYQPDSLNTIYRLFKARTTL